MNWKFWQKDTGNATGERALPKPKEPPAGIGRYLVVNLKQDPDWVWTLKCVEMVRPGQKAIRDFRIFDPKKAQERAAVIRNYTHLDSQADLILYDGWYNKDTWEMSVTEHRATGIDGKAA